MIPAEVDLLEPKVLLTATASTPQTNSPCPAAASGQTCHALVLEGDDSDELIAAAFNTYVVNGVQKNTYEAWYQNAGDAEATQILDLGSGFGHEVPLARISYVVIRGNGGNDNIQMGSFVGAGTEVNQDGLALAPYSDNTINVFGLLYGGDGADFISGGNGHDQIWTGDTVGGDSFNDADSDGVLDFADIDLLTNWTDSNNNGADDALEIGGASSNWASTNADPNVPETANFKALNYVNGGFGDDTIFGSSLVDRLEGSDGEDGIYGRGGDDFLNGNFGTDTLAGGAGDDYMVGGASSERDVMYGQGGNDNMNGNGGDDYMDGGSGNDEMRGGDGADDIYGKEGNDQLFGGAGDDLLHGGTGTNEMTGGLGADYFYGALGIDTVWDWNPSEGDTKFGIESLFS